MSLLEVFIVLPFPNLLQHSYGMSVFSAGRRFVIIQNDGTATNLGVENAAAVIEKWRVAIHK